MFQNKQEHTGKPQRFLVFPREHGAWFMLLLSLSMGAGAAGSFNMLFVMAGLSAIALFCALFSLGEGARKAAISRDSKREKTSSLIYLVLAFIFTAPLLFFYPLKHLILLGLPGGLFIGLYLFLILTRQNRTLWGEIINIAGLSFPAAVSYYVSSGVWSRQILLLWLLTFLYSAASIFYVRVKVKQKAPYEASFLQRFSLGKALLGYLLFLALALAALAIIGLIPYQVSIAYLPLALKSLVSIFFSRGTTSIIRVGLLETGHSALFVVLFLLAFHLI